MWMQNGETKVNFIMTITVTDVSVIPEHFVKV
jgi:hypothetical protein